MQVGSGGFSQDSAQTDKVPGYEAKEIRKAGPFAVALAHNMKKKGTSFYDTVKKVQSDVKLLTANAQKPYFDPATIDKLLHVYL